MTITLFFLFQKQKYTANLTNISWLYYLNTFTGEEFVYLTWDLAWTRRRWKSLAPSSAVQTTRTDRFALPTAMCTSQPAKWNVTRAGMNNKTWYIQIDQRWAPSVHETVTLGKVLSRRRRSSVKRLVTAKKSAGRHPKPFVALMATFTPVAARWKSRTAGMFSYVHHYSFRLNLPCRVYRSGSKLNIHLVSFFLCWCMY